MRDDDAKRSDPNAAPGWAAACAVWTGDFRLYLRGLPRNAGTGAI